MNPFSLLAVATSLALANGLHAQEQKASTTNRAEVETKWPGVLFAISRLELIQDNRLLVFVRVVATSKSAPSGRYLARGRRFLPVRARTTLRQASTMEGHFPSLQR